MVVVIWLPWRLLQLYFDLFTLLQLGSGYSRKKFKFSVHICFLQKIFFFTWISCSDVTCSVKIVMI